MPGGSGTGSGRATSPHRVPGPFLPSVPTCPCWVAAPLAPPGLPSEGALGRVCHPLPCPRGWCFAQKLPCPGCKGRGRARSLLLPFPPLGPGHLCCAQLSLGGGGVSGVLGPPQLMPQSRLGTGAVPGCAALAPRVSLLQGAGTLSTGTSRTKVRHWCHHPSVALALAAAALPWLWALLLAEAVSAPPGDSALARSCGSCQRRWHRLSFQVTTCTWTRMVSRAALLRSWLSSSSTHRPCWAPCDLCWGSQEPRFWLG